MNRLIATLCLGVTLSLPLAARADEAADRLTAATTLVNKTLIKNLQTGFNVALEKTVAPMPEARAEAVRKELLAEFEKQRGIMIEGLSKDYAEKFTPRRAEAPRRDLRGSDLPQVPDDERRPELVGDGDLAELGHQAPEHAGRGRGDRQHPDRPGAPPVPPSGGSPARRQK